MFKTLRSFIYKKDLGFVKVLKWVDKRTLTKVIVIVPLDIVRESVSPWVILPMPLLSDMVELRLMPSLCGV